MRRYLILFALLTVVLTACRVESNVILDIEEDGSATVGAEIGFDDEFRQLLGESGADPDDLFGDLPDLGGDDVEQTERTEGDMEFFGVTSRVDDLSTFEFGGGQTDVFSSFSYTYDDASATLDATVEAEDLGQVTGDQELPIDPSTITDEFFSANVVVTMPGSVTQHNADEVRSDGTLVWSIPFTGTKQIEATSEFGASSTNILLIVLLALLAVGIVAAVIATVRSRRASERAVQDAAAAYTGAPPAPSGGTVAEPGGAPETLELEVHPHDDEIDDDEDQPDRT